ncbi:MAG: hypothetical protein EOO39_10685 [Cytophagaceae bacterium]|nr:MAG: hypothetical protein EOO39_10685 [Cytophagaceae bacterium]
MSLVTPSDLDLLRLDLSIKAKNGLNFILAAIFTWLLITWIWTLSYEPSTRALLTFYAGGVLLPLAWLFSKVLHTNWNMPDHPLQPLGLWLNFAQLVYFPILVFMYVRHPDYFIMVYVVITGAHFLPYAWFYDTKAYVIVSVVISVGAMWLGLTLPTEDLYLIPLFMSASLIVLGVWLLIDYRTKK